jgi:hypothetical protein
MTLYYLCKNVTAVQTLPTAIQGGPAPANLPVGSQGVNPNPVGAGSALQLPNNQTFQLIVLGTAGNVSATAQLIVSNDGVNWINLATVAATSGASPNSAGQTGTAVWNWYSAYITAISGTGASATVIMNA